MYKNNEMTAQESSGNTSLVPTDVPYTSILFSSVLESLRAHYAKLRIVTIGSSVMGVPIYCMKIGEGERQLSYSATYHANEWITTPVLLRFAEEYLKGVEEGTEFNGISAEILYKKFTLFFVPLVNPDGVDLVNGFLNSGFYYERAKRIAEDYPEIPFPDGWKANIEGVDLNLQFPAGWEKARQIKFSQGYETPAPRDYVGEAPLTAPESVAMYDLTTRNQFELILAYHSQGEVIYWKYLDYDPEHAEELADYFGKVSGYEVAETPSESGYAGYKDWFIQDYDRPGYTIEVGSGVNPLPLSQFDQIYQDNIGILTGAMTELTKIM